MSGNIFKLRLERADLSVILEENRKKKEFTDVKLQIGDQLFDAHRNVLSAYSPVLKAMLSDQWSTTKICPIIGEYVDPSIVEELLHFLYTGSIDLTPDNVHPVCVAAHFLQIATLLQPAVQHLCQLISVDNVLTLFEFSLACQLEQLLNHCLRFIVGNNAIVFQNPQILKFSLENFKGLVAGLGEQLSNPKRQLRASLFDCIVRWTEVNLSERLNELPVLLKSIPLEKLSHDFLTGTVSSHPLVKSSISGSQTVSAAIAAIESRWRRPKNVIVHGENWVRENEKTNTIRCYDLQNGSWTTLPPMLEARVDFGCTIINERDIVVSNGSYFKRGTAYTHHSVEMLDWASQTWKRLGDLPPGRSIFDVEYSIAALNGELFAMGGEFDPQRRAVPKPSRGTFFGYCFETEQWKPLASLKHARSMCQLVVYNDCLYAFAGATKFVEKYDSAADEWTVLEQTANERFYTVTIHEGNIYGSSDRGKLEIFNPESGHWSLVSTDTSILGIHGINKLISVNGRLLSFTDRGIISEFDFSTRKWKEFCTLEPKFRVECMLAGAFY